MPKKYGRGSGISHPVDIHVGNRLRRRREECGYSQEKLAERINLTFQQIQKYERGANRISASRLWELAETLDVRAQYFYDGYSSNHNRKKPLRQPPPGWWSNLFFSIESWQPWQQTAIKQFVSTLKQASRHASRSNE